jgi:hypothetical protein
LNGPRLVGRGDLGQLIQEGLFGLHQLAQRSERFPAFCDRQSRHDFQGSMNCAARLLHSRLAHLALGGQGLQLREARLGKVQLEPGPVAGRSERKPDFFCEALNRVKGIPRQGGRGGRGCSNGPAEQGQHQAQGQGPTHDRARACHNGASPRPESGPQPLLQRGAGFRAQHRAWPRGSPGGAQQRRQPRHFWVPGEEGFERKPAGLPLVQRAV